MLSAFDLVWLNGNDYRSKPLMHRKAVLGQLVPSGSVCVLYVSEVMEQGVELFRLACERNLEGIVAKHKDSVYGDGAGWLKIKNPEYTQAVGGPHDRGTNRSRLVAPVQGLAAADALVSLVF